jgi:hypothetical protein
LFSCFQAEVPWKGCDNAWNTERCWDGTLNVSSKRNDTRSPSEEFYRYKVLKESASMEDFGWPDWQLLLILVFAYIVVYFCIWKGVKSTGKVVYVTAIFPYIVLVIMLIRGVTLEGAQEGIKFFLVPKWGDLLKPDVINSSLILKTHEFTPKILNFMIDRFGLTQLFKTSTRSVWLSEALFQCQATTGRTKKFWGKRTTLFFFSN